MKPIALVLVLAQAALAACAAVAGAPASSSAPAAAPAAASAPPARAADDAAKPFEAVGILVARDAAPVALWPEEHSGPWTVAEVVEHGARVAAGDVVLRLDARKIDEELHRRELELVSSELRHRNLLKGHELEAAAARSARARSQAGLERAGRALQGYKDLELAFAERQDGIQERYEQSYVEDQTDELDQLQKMYEDDALVDATEDIVLKRSQRQLELTRTSNKLARDRSAYRKDYEQRMTLEQREEALAAQREEHERLLVQQELDAAERADQELRSADALRLAREALERLRRDRALFELRAPRAGVLLHGGTKALRPGASPVRHERGSELAGRGEVLLVAAPAPDAVRLELSDDLLRAVAAGAEVQVVSLERSEASARGTLAVEPFPRSASATEASYAATVTLEHPLEGVALGSRAKVTLVGTEK